MKTRRSWLILGMLLVPVGAHADSHKSRMFVAASYVNASDLIGFHLSYEQTIHKLCEKEPALRLKTAGGDVETHRKCHWSVVLDLGAHFPVNDDDDQERTIMAGWRYSRGAAWKDHTTGGHTTKETKWMYFGQVLLGYARTGVESKPDSDFAVALGGGVDWLMGSECKLGLGLQVDAVKAAHWYPRVSIGFVKRWSYK